MLAQQVRQQLNNARNACAKKVIRSGETQSERVVKNARCIEFNETRKQKVNVFLKMKCLKCNEPWKQKVNMNSIMQEMLKGAKSKKKYKYSTLHAQDRSRKIMCWLDVQMDTKDPHIDDIR